MALRSHEYVECQEQRKRPLILSEVGLDPGSHVDEFGSLTVFGNSLRELTRTVVSVHVSRLILGTSETPPPPFIRSFPS